MAALQRALASGNVIVTTDSAGADAGDITVAESVSWSNASNLTLSADRHITVFDGVSIANSGAGSLALRADRQGTGTGTVDFAGSGKVDFSAGTGTASIYYNPATGYASPTDYAPFVPSGSMSGERKRGEAYSLKPPPLSSTLPLQERTREPQLKSSSSRSPSSARRTTGARWPGKMAERGANAVARLCETRNSCKIASRLRIKE